MRTHIQCNAAPDFVAQNDVKSSLIRITALSSQIGFSFGCLLLMEKNLSQKLHDLKLVRVPNFFKSVHSFSTRIRLRIPNTDQDLDPETQFNAGPCEYGSATLGISFFSHLLSIYSCRISSFSSFNDFSSFSSLISFYLVNTKFHEFTLLKISPFLCPSSQFHTVYIPFIFRLMLTTFSICKPVRRMCSHIIGGPPRECNRYVVLTL